MIDITDPANPQIVGSVDTPGTAWRLAVSGTHTYVADFESGLQVIDITDPASPQIVGSVDTPDNAQGVAVSGSYAYVAAGESGLQVLPIQCEPSEARDEDRVASAVLLRAFPNPSSARTVIRFVTPLAGLVQASVYDPAGRSVRSLSNGILAAGVHDLSWDGRDDSGRAVPGGVYLVRVSTAEGTTSGRFVIVR